MAKSSLPIALFLLLNILFFSVTSACNYCPPGGSGTPSGGSGTPSPGSTNGRCPRDALKLGVCANVLGNLLKGVVVGDPLNTPCCSLLQGLVDLEAAICLCTAIKANLLGIKLNIPVSLSLLLNVCDRNVPPRFQC